MSESSEEKRRERYLYVLNALIGREVKLDMLDGESVNGLFHTATPFKASSHKIVLKGLMSGGATAIIDASKVRQVYVRSMTMERRDKFATDTEISQNSTSSSSVTRRSKLEALDASWIAPVKLEQNNEAWDQFETNERLFNIKSSFDENLYTTPLLSQDPKLVARAARIARDIENTRTSNIHRAEERGHKIDDAHLDEEDRFSGVARKEVLKPKATKTHITSPLNQAAAAPPAQTPPLTVSQQEAAKSGHKEVPMKKSDTAITPKEEEILLPPSAPEKKPDTARISQKEEVVSTQPPQKNEKTTLKLNANAPAFTFNADATEWKPPPPPQQQQQPQQQQPRRHTTNNHRRGRQQQQQQQFAMQQFPPYPILPQPDFPPGGYMMPPDSFGHTDFSHYPPPPGGPHMMTPPLYPPYQLPPFAYGPRGAALPILPPAAPPQQLHPNHHFQENHIPPPQYHQSPQQHFPPPPPPQQFFHNTPLPPPILQHQRHDSIASSTTAASSNQAPSTNQQPPPQQQQSSQQQQQQLGISPPLPPSSTTSMNTTTSSSR